MGTSDHLPDLQHTGSAEADAKSLLTSTWAPRFPEVFPAPVDPTWIAQGLGIQVYVGVLDEGVSGMLVKRARLQPEIYLNKLDHENRQRFTCAHELGHYVMRAGSDDDAWEYVDARGATASQGTHADEIYANRFAAALLMPREIVARLIDQGQSSLSMAFQLGVSVEAMDLRLKNLGLQTK